MVRKQTKYRRIVEDILIQIRSGSLRPGDLVLSESDLVKTYGVSLMTVKTALYELVERDQIVRVQGKGTFVKCSVEQSTMNCQTHQT